MHRFIVFTCLLARSFSASDPVEPKDQPLRPEKIGEDLKIKYDTLRKAEEDSNLVQDYEKAKAAETNATFAEKVAKVEEVKADIKIYQAEADHNQTEVVAATEDKEHAKEAQKLDEAIIHTAKEEETVIKTQEIKVDQQFNQTLQGDVAQSKDTSLNEALVEPKHGTLSYGGAIVLFLLLGGVVVVCSNIMRRQQLMENMAHISNYPMMAGFQKNEDDAARMQGVAQKLHAGFKEQLSLSGYSQYQDMAV